MQSGIRNGSISFINLLETDGQLQCECNKYSDWNEGIFTDGEADGQSVSQTPSISIQYLHLQKVKKNKLLGLHLRHLCRVCIITLMLMIISSGGRVR